MKYQRIPNVCYKLLLFFLLCVPAFALEQDGYTTPNSWSMQTAPGQFRQSLTGVGLTPDSKLYMTLTTRMRIKSDDYADDYDLFQYVRLHTDPVKLGQGTVKVAAFGRIADDIDGDQSKDWSDKYFYSQRDLLDTDLDQNDLAPRLYHGYVQFDNVIQNTKLNLGRFYLEHLNSFQLDGADATVKFGDMFSVYAYGGAPVSYYFDTDSDSLYGAGAKAMIKNTKIEGEYTSFDTDDIDDDYTRLRVTQSLPSGYVMVGYQNINDASTYNADLSYEIVATGTIVTLGYETMTDDMTSEKAYVVNPITYTLLDMSKYSLYKASVFQAFMKHFAAGVNYEKRTTDGTENFDNRDYNKYGFQFDINGLPGDDTYISFTADKWAVDGVESSSDDNRFQYGLQVSQKVNDQVDVWVGTSFSRYEYDYETDKRKDSVRSYYVGGQYQPVEVFSLMLDLSREDTDFYDDVDTDLSTSYRAELWANIAF